MTQRSWVQTPGTVYQIGTSNKIKPETLGDRCQSMTIQFDSNVSVAYQQHPVTEADFDVGDRQYIGYHTDANDAYRRIADGSR